MNEHEGRPTMDAGASARLVPMRSLSGYRLAAGEPDIRGWEVRDRDGGRLGAVEDLLIDADTNEVAALAVSSGRGVSVIPMSAALIDDRTRTIMTASGFESDAAVARPAAGAESSVRASPTAAAVDSTRLDAERAASASARERAVEAGYPGATVERTADGEEIIRIPIVEEELVVERRPVVKEVVVVRKRAATEQRVIEADLRRERIDVDRRDGSGG